jgi:hypothetical protein
MKNTAWSSPPTDRRGTGTTRGPAGAPLGDSSSTTEATSRSAAPTIAGSGSGNVASAPQFGHLVRFPAWRSSVLSRLPHAHMTLIIAPSP